MVVSWWIFMYEFFFCVFSWLLDVNFEVRKKNVIGVNYVHLIEFAKPKVLKRILIPKEHVGHPIMMMCVAKTFFCSGPDWDKKGCNFLFFQRIKGPQYQNKNQCIFIMNIRLNRTLKTDFFYYLLFYQFKNCRNEMASSFSFQWLLFGSSQCLQFSMKILDGWHGRVRHALVDGLYRCFTVKQAQIICDSHGRVCHPLVALECTKKNSNLQVRATIW